MEEEVFEEFCTGGNADAEHESIKEFLEKISHTEPDAAKGLYEKWGGICEDLEINLHYVRNTMDPWFQECYRSRKDVGKLNADVSCEMADRRKEELLEQFDDNMKAVADKSDNIINKYKVLQELENTKNLPLGCWVNRAIDCVDKENELIADFKKVKFNAEIEEATQKMDKAIQQAEYQCNTILQKVNQFSNGVDNYLRYRQMFDDKEETVKSFELVLAAKNDKKGVSQKKLTELKTELQSLKKSVEDTTGSLSQSIQDVHELLGHGYNMYKGLIYELLELVNNWRKQFQFEYAELGAEPVSLERIAPWCALVGKQLYDLLFDTLVKYSNSYHNLNLEANSDEVIKGYEDLLFTFLQKTFVVTEQEHYIIKVDKKNFPKITVRILAADYFPAHISKIEARFLYEDVINAHRLDEPVSAETMARIPTCAEFENKKKNATVSFQSGKRKRKCCEGTFHSLQFKGKFVRPGNPNNKQVHEEKYRILFLTTLNDWTLWTMSLPLVVTTGANQGCLCQASIMWQCFSTDVHKLPIVNREELEWSDVADMLQAKMRKLCPNRRLNEDNLIHLKRRLFGKDVGTERVTLKMFCFDKMVKTYGSDDECLSFSFWKWFIGVYNLIDRYLLKYWKEDLIYGFISKEEAKEKLKRCSSGRSGTFILRFSDQNISDSQGVKSVFAHLTATVLMIKETDGRKKKCVYDLDVAGHSKLKIKNLAYILMQTIEAKKNDQANIFQYVYPGKKKREDTFDKHCDEETVVQGYNGTKDAFIIDLNHAMCALEIDTGKHVRSPSIDSGFPLSPQGSETSAAPVKRSRASIEQQHPTISNMLYSRTPLSSPAYSTQGSSNGASPCYAPFSPDSPAQRNNSPPNSMPQHQVLSPSMQNEFAGQVNPSLPTVINDVDLQSGERFMGKYNPSGLLNRRNSPVQDAQSQMLSNTPPDGHMLSSLSDDGSSHSADEQVEVVISNDDDFTLQFEGQNGTNTVIYAVHMDNGQYEIVKDQATIKSILQQQQQQQNQQPASNLVQENFVSTNQMSPSEQQLMLLSALSDLPEEQLQTLLSGLPEDQRSNFLHLTAGFSAAVSESFPSVTTQSLNPTLNNTVDSMADMLISTATSTLDTPTLTSSGSVSDAFNFTMPEIAEARDLNSGSIDINMFDMTSSGSGMHTGGNMSSGSSFGLDDA